MIIGIAVFHKIISTVMDRVYRLIVLVCLSHSSSGLHFLNHQNETAREFRTTVPVSFSQTALQQQDMPSIQPEKVVRKEQTMVNTQTDLQHRARPTFIPSEVFHEVQTSTRIPYSSTKEYPFFRNSSRSDITTHSYVEMSSKNAPADGHDTHKLFEDNKQYVCVFTRERKQPNATVKTIECSVPKGPRLRQTTFLSACKIQLSKLEVLGLMLTPCDAITTDTLRLINGLVHNERMFSIENNTVIPVNFICVIGSEYMGSIHKVHICPIKEGEIPPSDHLEISKYLQKVCGLQKAFITKSSVKTVDKMKDCSSALLPKKNSHDFSNMIYRQYIGYIVVLGMSIVGILANSMAIVVFANGGLEHTKKSKSTTLFILMLSMELLTLAISFCLTIVLLKIIRPLPSGVCHLTYVVHYFSFFGSTYSILLITIERYIVICHPLRAKTILTESLQRMVRMTFT